MTLDPTLYCLSYRNKYCPALVLQLQGETAVFLAFCATGSDFPSSHFIYNEGPVPVRTKSADQSISISPALTSCAT